MPLPPNRISTNPNSPSIHNSAYPMDNPADVVAGVTDLRTPPSSSRLRRRLVQSTLFPHIPHDTATAGDDCDRDEDRDDDEDEEYCGSSLKKKTKKKPRKTKPITPKLRASKKVVVTNKDVPKKGVADEESPVTNMSNFFAKVSEKRQQKRQRKDQSCVGSVENNDKSSFHEDDAKCNSPPDSETYDERSPRRWKRCCSATPEKHSTSATCKKRRASATPEKHGKNTTPKQKVIVSGSNNGLSGQITNNTQGEHTSQLIPDLRLEAKLKAEENSRIYGGRQIHPFFSSRKMVKINQEGTDEENNWSLVNKKDRSITVRPIHVFEQVKDDDFSPDWGNWVFLESNSFNCDFKNELSTFYERPVKSLRFDNLFTISGQQSNGSSDFCPVQVDEVLSHHSPNKQDCFPSAPYIILTDEQVPLCEKSGEREVNHNMSNVSTRGGDDGCGQNSTFKMIYGHDLVNQPENSLWTIKYQPKLANQICGNGEHVHFLNNWLHLWHEKGSGTSKTVGDIYRAQDADYSYTSETDFDDMEEENRLKNVLLITGPVGSGKSAAIYACAKEQGFQVIEVNSSDWRNGALVKQKFGEAVESHWLKCSAENPERSDIKNFFKSFPVSSNAIADQGISNDVTELISLSDDEISGNTRMTPKKSVSKKRKTGREQSGDRTLILFEDVDADLCEDRGFISTIQQLAETAKRPMILTSNSNNPVLPNNLDRLELCFSKPSLEELLCLVSMVCSAEEVVIPPCLVKRFIEFCQGDIRKTILQLQFWCQGQSCIRDRKVFGPYGLMIFDPDAGHNILPKMISSSYTSQLSEMVDKEITKSLLEMEEASRLTVVDEDLKNNDLGTLTFQPNSIDARKEAMLCCHCSDQDGNELPSQPGTACEFSDASDSPVAFGRRSVRRRTDTVLSSESGEDCSNDGFPAVPSKLSGDIDSEAHLEGIGKAFSHCFAPEISSSPVAEELVHSDGEKVEDSCYPYAITEEFVLLNGKCKSVDVSCVPESTFVAETQIYSDAVSWGNVDNTAETAFIKNDIPLSDINLNISSSGLHEIPVLMGNDCDAVPDSDIKKDEITDFRINGAEMASTKCGFSSNDIDLNASPHAFREIPVLLNNNCHSITESVQDEVADSNAGCVRAVPREYQGMDECSRMNFSMRYKYKHQSSLLASDTVQETWRKLRNCHMDLNKYATLEHKDASKFLKFAHGMSNLISEADLLLSDCQLLICDYLKPSMFPCETSHSHSWYDDQLKMVSTISEHGMCFYAKHIDAASAKMVSSGRVDLAWEMLASTTDTMALGKLVGQDKKRIQNLDMGLSRRGNLSQREFAASLCSVVQSIIPTGSYLSVKGNALHEYLSSLSQISRSEANRLSESLQKSRRRVRVARNYLTTTTPSLNPEDLSLLNEYNCYQKVSPQTMEED